MDITRIEITETVDQARHRLAQQARESGVKVRIGSDGRFFVSSASRFGHEHFVTAWSCDCDGFAQRGRCMHRPRCQTRMTIPATPPPNLRSKWTGGCRPTLRKIFLRVDHEE